MDETTLKPCPFCGKEPVRVSIGTASCDGMVDGKEVHNTIGMRPECWNARPTDPGEDKVEAVAAWKDALAYTLDDWQALSRIVKTNIVETDGPDRVRWEGVWYEGPLATAYHRTLRAIEKMADRNIEILSPLTGAAIAAMGHTPPSGEDGQ